MFVNFLLKGLNLKKIEDKKYTEKQYFFDFKRILNNLCAFIDKIRRKYQEKVIFPKNNIFFKFTTKPMIGQT